MVNRSLLRAHCAQLPAPAGSDDRAFITDNAVIVLDGASAFAPQSLPAATYSETLGRQIARRLTEHPDDPLKDCLRDSIGATAAALNLSPGPTCPSSTVAIARSSDDHIDLLCLGDSLIVHPNGRLTDDRLANLATDHRQAYRDRLSKGHGYDQTHAQLLHALQTSQREHRNKPDGYWIAEADPSAADHAVTDRIPMLPDGWLVLATDGAYRPLEHRELDDWHEIAAMTPQALRNVLTDCDEWETHVDPHGQILPRAKRHDDKTLAVARIAPGLHV